jgi:hypothetical protein
MNHVLIGAGIPFLVCALVYAARRCRASFAWLIATPVAMALGATWALVPDMPRLLGMQDLYLRWMHDPRMNLFFWHYKLDEVESDSPLVIAACVLLVILLFIAAWRELRLRERGV